ncbi:enoyl-CoA hydratase [Jeotgalibacillus soli]|nr:enoyl-CoA hydratase [Jeotgalibacillus soli]
MGIKTDYKKIKVSVEGTVGWVSLNQPDRLNALQTDLMLEMAQALKELNREPDINIVVLKGEGRAFCSGGDIKSMLESNGEEHFQRMMEAASDVSMTLYSMDKLTISAIHGAAAGLGYSLALATDIIVAEEGSKLAMNFIGIGLVPDGGGHYFLKERIGASKAMQLIWAGDVMNGHEAQAVGLIDHVVAEGKVMAEVKALVQSYQARPLKAMLETKSILRRGQWRELKKVLEMEQEAQWRMRQTEDHQEGIRAFVGKRKPNFKGQ